MMTDSMTPFMPKTYNIMVPRNACPDNAHEWGDLTVPDNFLMAGATLHNFCTRCGMQHPSDQIAAQKECEELSRKFAPSFRLHV